MFNAPSRSRVGQRSPRRVSHTASHMTSVWTLQPCHNMAKWHSRTHKHKSFPTFLPGLTSRACVTDPLHAAMHANAANLWPVRFSADSFAFNAHKRRLDDTLRPAEHRKKSGDMLRAFSKAAAVLSSATGDSVTWGGTLWKKITL